MPFDGVAVFPCVRQHLRYRRPALLPHKLNDLERQLGHHSEDFLLTLYFYLKPFDLRVYTPQKNSSQCCQLGASSLMVPCVWRSAK